MLLHERPHVQPAPAADGDAQVARRAPAVVEIDRPRRLVFTWAIAPDADDASRVVIEIAPQGTGCALTLTHAMQPKWVDFAPRVEAGWSKMLDALGTTLD